MQPTELPLFLSHFGIEQHRNEVGELSCTIKIITGDAGVESQTARFDAQLGAWRLQQSKHDTPSTRQTPNKIVRDRIQTTWPSGLDWTNALPSSAHNRMLLDLDWNSTPVGPLKGWPRSLQLYTHMLLSDARAASIFWGSQRIAIYNEASIPLIGTLHPALMGRSFEEALPTLWDFFGPLFHDIEEDQHGFARNGLELPVMRHGYLEESWWDGGFVALRDDNGSNGGAYFSWTEVTRTTLRDRRTKIVNRLDHPALASTHSFWQHVHSVLKEHPRDIPMAIMYITDESDASSGRLYRKHDIGLGITYTAAPSEVNLALGHGTTGLASLLQRAQKTSADFVVVDVTKEDIDPTVFENVDWLGFGEPSRHLVVIPVRDKLSTQGYIIVGLNPRRDFDEDHEQFVRELTRQLNDTVTKTTFRKALQRRERELTTELSESERRASKMAEIVPVGIYELGMDGTLQWANNQFFEVMGVPHEQRNKESFVWVDHILPEDHDRANKKMGEALLQGVEISDSLRLRRDWIPPGSDPGCQAPVEPCWVLYAASPNFNPDGTIYSLTGSITDISHLKWAEQLQVRNAELAQKERQIQEEFIDITSHEMRNPLSAITQSADGILLSLQDAETYDDPQSLRDLISLNAEAAESILFCAAHQRRIIDDILTLGKLDSKLLAISPSAFQMEDLIDQTLQMFKAEFEVNRIQMHTIIDTADSIKSITSFNGDASRLLQVLVNMMTNAIKFTKTQLHRTISVRHGSSLTPPMASLFGPNFKWYCTKTSRPDLTQDPEYGHGPVEYVYFAVTDTGEGIPSTALERIFTKFEQADRRTHTKYGGSGLGLYISRELAEMQGGCIGIESAVGIGSTFAFYAKVRRSETQTSLKSISTNHTRSASSTRMRVSRAPSFNCKQVSTNSQAPKSYNILLVEDNVLNQTVLAKQLERAGHVVELSSHGGEAVDAILRLHRQPVEYGSLPPVDSLPHIDCILMDWEMPVCDGIQATKTIRSIEAQQGAARSLIIGVTANARAEQIAKAIEAGMDSVLPKPFRVAELLVKIRDLTSVDTA